MCGFIAGYNINGFNPSKIKESLSLINHRGPDQSHYNIIEPTIMMGHNRLSIVGLNNGQQPLFFNGIWAVVNGEFYDYQTIRNDLIEKGFTFKTESDSEILLYLYQLYGAKCLDFLHGEFSFVLYDSNKKIWFAARDRFGIRPIHWLKDKNSLFFASEAKAFSPFYKLELDKENFWFSQHFQYLPQDKSLFKNINLIKPAHYLLVNDNNVHEVCYYTPTEQTTNDSISTATEKIEYLLEEAVKRRIPSEVKSCTHLSGGIDSSSITYLTQKHNIKDAFTISFTDDSFYNEVEFAKKTANHLGVNLHIVEANFNDILQSIPKAIYHAEGLSINGHLGGKYLLNKAIHEAGFKVAFSGEGSDEIFMGYSHLKQDYLSKSSLSNMENSYLAGFQLPSGETFNLDDFESVLGFVPTWLQAKSSMAKKFSTLWHENFNYPNPNQKFLQNMDLGNYSKLKQSSFLWSRYCLSGYILKVLDDAQSMAFSIEGRLPFLDTKLVDYVFSLPDSFYFDGNTEKNILKKIMLNKLPHEITSKTKQSFMSPPLTKSLQNPLNEKFIKDILFNSYFTNQNLFDKERLEKQINQWKESPTPDSEPIIMTLLSIASLCEAFKL